MPRKKVRQIALGGERDDRAQHLLLRLPDLALQCLSLGILPLVPQGARQIVLGRERSVRGCSGPNVLSSMSSTCPFASLTHLQHLQFALGNPSPIQKKDYKLCMEVVVPLCVEFAGALRRHLELLVSLAPSQTFACCQKNKLARKTAAAGTSHPSSSAHTSNTLVGSRGKAPTTESEDGERQASDINSDIDSASPDLGRESSSNTHDPNKVLSSAQRRSLGLWSGKEPPPHDNCFTNTRTIHFVSWLCEEEEESCLINLKR